MTANPTMDVHVTQYMECLLQALSGPQMTKEAIADIMTGELYKTLRAFQREVIAECVDQYQAIVDQINISKDKLIAEARAERDIANTISVKTQTEIIALRHKLAAPKKRQQKVTGRKRKRA